MKNSLVIITLLVAGITTAMTPQSFAGAGRVLQSSEAVELYRASYSEAIRDRGNSKIERLDRDLGKLESMGLLKPAETTSILALAGGGMEPTAFVEQVRADVDASAIAAAFAEAVSDFEPSEDGGKNEILDLLQDMAKGAAAGAIIGSLFGGAGGTVGGVIGAIAAAIGWLFGRKKKNGDEEETEEPAEGAESS